MEIQYSSNRNNLIVTHGDLIRDFISFAKEYDEPVTVMSKVFQMKLKAINNKYDDYLKKHLNSNLLSKLDDIALTEPIRTLDDILEPNEQIILRDFIIHNGEEENDEEERLWAELMYEDLDLNSAFQKYIEFRNINDGIFISYINLEITSFVGGIKKAINEITIEIDTIYDFKSTVGDILSAEYINYHKKRITEDYFKNLITSIQLYGFFDNKGLFIDKNLTFKNALKFYNYTNNQTQNNKYDFESFDCNSNLSYLRYRYFYYKFYKAEPDALFDKNKKKLKDEFEVFKRENSKLTTYLSGKSFDIQEIDIILNLLSNNRYSELEIRSINLIQVNLFRCLWLFGIFDYFVEKENSKFESIKDFEVLLMLNKKNGYDLKSNSAQFKKYYHYIKELNHDDDPFNPNKTEKLIQTIESELGINREKLNSLPK